MVRRLIRLFGLLGLLVALIAVGCRAPAPRTPAPSSPQPLPQSPQTPQTPPLGGNTLAIDDRPSPGTATVQQPLQPPVLAVQTIQPAQNTQLTTVKPVATTSPTPVGVPVATTPGPTPTPTAVSQLRNLYQICAQKNATLDNYIVMLRRREVVGGAKQPQEEVLLKFRKTPWSVYFKWLGEDANKGREVVYVKDRFKNQIHIKLGPKEFPGGSVWDKDLNDPMVKSKSRHPITEAGIGNMIDHFGNLLDADEMAAPQNRTLKYLGPVQRTDYAKGAALEAVYQYIPQGREQLLPRGGQRWWFFDGEILGLPVMIVTLDDRNQEVEYYAYEQLSLRLQGFAEEEFNPDQLWHRK